MILLVAPFVGYGFLAHAVNGAVLSVLLLVGLWRLLLYLEISRAIRALVLLACSTGFSPEWAEHMFGQTSYGYVCLLLVWTLLASGKYLIDGRPERRHAIVAVAVFLLAGLNGTRGVLTYAMPVAIGVLGSAWWTGAPDCW
ncbi:MAG: hypothetical protein DMF86_06035 [Acidobacteria bacterium]|nr:MAG: hypothetical protein DMF86_06035 [Acidobacteriota bacterium]